MENAINVARVSDPKQVIKGDSLDDQLIKTKNFIEEQGWCLDKSFPLIETGRKAERKFFDEVYEYCKSKKDTKNKIDYLVILNIGRFTRGGRRAYEPLKEKFESIGVKVRDIYGTIGEKINLLKDEGFEYDWSIYSPTEGSEFKEADERASYVKQELVQVIRGAITNVQKGYWNGPAPFGLATKRTDTKYDGVRYVLTERPNTEDSRELFFIKKIMELRAMGTDDAKTVTILNDLGFSSRICAKRDPRTHQKIGTKGGVLLTIKKIQELVVNPIYVGIILVKWTHYEPVKAEMFDGIVDVETFNRANRGKIFVVKNKDGTIEIKHNVNLARLGEGIKRMKYNPIFPFKCVVRCPLCGKEVKASSPRNGSGDQSPRYHCDRNHKYWSKDSTKVSETIEGYLSKLKFSDSAIDLFQEAFLEKWEENNIKALDESKEAENYVAKLLEQQKDTRLAFRTANSESMKKAFESEYDDLEIKIKEARNNRKEKEEKELDIKALLQQSRELMERPEKLLIDRENMVHQRQLFGLAFEEMPTFDNYANGTAKLRPLFQLKDNELCSKSDYVQRIGVEPTLQGFTDLCLTARLPLVLMLVIITNNFSKIPLY